MKKILFNKIAVLFLLLVPMLWAGCDKDEDTKLDNILHYDGDNLTAPLLPPGTSELAVRFTSTHTTPLAGRKLEEVRFYVKEVPDKCEVVIYDMGGASLPGTELYSQDVTASLKANSWVTHTLSTPVEIKGQDLWISTRITDSSQGNYVGCDAGPNQTNGDWMYLPTDNKWSPFKIRVPSESVNWNIRGVVSE